MMLHPVSKLIEALTLETLGVHFLLDFFEKEISGVFMIIEAFVYLIKNALAKLREVGSIFKLLSGQERLLRGQVKRGENVERSRMAISLFSKLKIFFGF